MGMWEKAAATLLPAYCYCTSVAAATSPHFERMQVITTHYLLENAKKEFFGVAGGGELGWG